MMLLMNLNLNMGEGYDEESAARQNNLMKSEPTKTSKLQNGKWKTTQTSIDETTYFRWQKRGSMWGQLSRVKGTHNNHEKMEN
jgi:hypothetical protein